MKKKCGFVTKWAVFKFSDVSDTSPQVQCGEQGWVLVWDFFNKQFWTIPKSLCNNQC